MYHWGVTRSKIKRENDDIRKKLIAKLISTVNKIINHPDTVKKSIADWPNVYQFIKGQFPSIDVSDLPVYQVSVPVMSRYGFDECGGCYIDDMKLILLKDKIEIHKKPKGKFAQKMHTMLNENIDPEDIVVHELLHAISFKTRSLSAASLRWYESPYGGIKYRSSEEEFVYTNCMPFYRSKGISDDQVIKSIFMPFCIFELTSDKDFISKIFEQLNMQMPQDDKEFSRVINKHADTIISCIIEESHKRAQHMIDLYDKYGCKSIPAMDKNLIDDNIVSRLDYLDMEDDFDADL